MSKADRLFKEQEYGTGEFRFDEHVAEVFDDMISRSVPLYAEVQKFAPRLVKLLEHRPLRVLDLGCSTGTTLEVLSRSLPEVPLELLGIDSSAEMLARCQVKLACRPEHHELVLHEARMQDFAMGEYSVVFLNYTLQFLPVSDRPEMLRRIFKSLRPGGFLLMSEKLVHADPALNELLQTAYFEYKRSKGYSELEIARKRDALEDVLVPCTVDENLKMLTEAGFLAPELLLKWFNFGTFLCRR